MIYSHIQTARKLDFTPFKWHRHTVVRAHAVLLITGNDLTIIAYNKSVIDS